MLMSFNSFTPKLVQMLPFTLHSAFLTLITATSNGNSISHEAKGHKKNGKREKRAK